MPKSHVHTMSEIRNCATGWATEEKPVQLKLTFGSAYIHNMEDTMFWVLFQRQPQTEKSCEQYWKFLS